MGAGGAAVFRNARSSNAGPKTGLRPVIEAHPLNGDERLPAAHAAEKIFSLQDRPGLFLFLARQRPLVFGQPRTGNASAQKGRQGGQPGIWDHRQSDSENKVQWRLCNTAKLQTRPLSGSFPQMQIHWQ